MRAALWAGCARRPKLVGRNRALPAVTAMSSPALRSEFSSLHARAVPADAAGDADGLPLPRRFAAVAAILGAGILVVLDGAIANVALPTIARQLNASPAGAVWIITAYQLA